MKIKRIIAWLIDWNLCGLPALIYAMIFERLARTQGTNIGGLLLFALLVLLFPTLFVFRDVLLNGRSIAKRMFRLRVIDNVTAQKPSNKKLVLRNLFFVAYPVELVLLIAKGRSLGDIVTKTSVVRQLKQSE